MPTPHPKRIDAFTATRRNLPHLQDPGRCYFITWRLALGGSLITAERDLVRDSISFWHPTRWFVHSAVVMPDHIHLLARMQPVELDNPACPEFHEMGAVLGSVKQFTATRLNRLRLRTGHVWQDERYDRFMRDDNEFDATREYIRGNPVRAGIVATPEEYPWLFGFAE